MTTQEIFNKAIETIADQYELLLNHFINQDEWEQRRDMGYNMIEALTGKTREDAMNALMKEATKRNLRP